MKYTTSIFDVLDLMAPLNLQKEVIYNNLVPETPFKIILASFCLKG